MTNGLGKLRITNSSGRGFDTRVELNGVDISRGVRRIVFDAEANEVCSAKVELLVGEVEVDGVSQLRFFEGVEELLTRLGWAPSATVS